MKKIFFIPLMLCTFVTAMQGQEYYWAEGLTVSQKYDYVIMAYKAIGYKEVGIVYFIPQISNRDIDIQLMDCLVKSAVDDNGNTYTNSYTIKHETLPIVSKGFYTKYYMDYAQCLVLPTSVTHLKELVFSFDREPTSCDDYNKVGSDYFYTKMRRLTDVTIKWLDCDIKAQHPAEFYFNRKHGQSEIVKGIEVNKYSGRTIIKGRPLMIVLLGAIGNQSTGEVCYVFYVVGNSDDEKLFIESMTAFDEDGGSYQYNDNDWNGQMVKIGKKYGGVEIQLIPFKVPVGTTSFQKLKLVGNSERDGNGGTYLFEWNNIPIQWVTPVN